MDAGRDKPDHDVARRNVLARQQRVARDRADRKTGKIVVVALIHAGHFGGLAADQGAARLAAGGGDAGNDFGADLRIELAAGEIIEKEQRLRPLHDQVVDRHGDEIDADGVVAGGFDGDFHLGADAVVGGNEDRIGVPGGLEVEQAAKTADLGVGARTRASRAPAA